MEHRSIYTLSCFESQRPRAKDFFPISRITLRRWDRSTENRVTGCHASPNFFYPMILWSLLTMSSGDHKGHAVFLITLQEWVIYVVFSGTEIYRATGRWTTGVQWADVIFTGTCASRVVSVFRTWFLFHWLLSMAHGPGIETCPSCHIGEGEG